MLEAEVAGGGRQRSRVLLCGYYGEHNLGDDALLQVLLSQLPPSLEPLVTAHDQAQVRERFGVATTDRRTLSGVLRSLGRCQALVLGGGSLLQDSTSVRSLLYYAVLILAARLQGKPVVLWGQGLGPLRRRRSRLLVRCLLPWVTAISWRDAGSAGLARSWGVSGGLGSDPVWAMAGPPWQGAGGAIVLCWRPTPLLAAEAWLPYLLALEHLAVAADRAVLWLPFHGGQDRALFDHLKLQGLMPPALAERSRLLSVSAPAEAMELFAHAGLVVAMRLHGLILAARAGAPVAALSYDPKVAAAAASIACPCHPLELPAPEDLAAQWLACLDHPADPERLQALSTAAECHRQVLERLGEVLRSH